MPKRLYEFTVRGRGSFPHDMLRYDACYPITPESVDSMERPTEVREVTLASRVGPPTDGRWESFGWKIVKLKTILSSR